MSKKVYGAVFVFLGFLTLVSLLVYALSIYDDDLSANADELALPVDWQPGSGEEIERPESNEGADPAALYFGPGDRGLIE
jgi:hypothetical protein